MRLGSIVIRPIVFPLCITLMAAPTRALHGHGHAKECAHVGDGTVQFLEVHIQRLALRTTRLLIESDALHVETFENRLIEKFLRVVHIGGIKLNVRVSDVENARKILDEPILEGLYVQGVGLYEQPRCPKCQSLDVNFQELDRPVAYMSAFLRVPMPVQRPAWRCHSCDAEWEDDGAEGSRSEIG